MRRVSELEVTVAVLSQNFNAALKGARHSMLKFAATVARMPRPGRCNAEKRNGLLCKLRAPCGIHR